MDHCDKPSIKMGAELTADLLHKPRTKSGRVWLQIILDKIERTTPIVVIFQRLLSHKVLMAEVSVDLCLLVGVLPAKVLLNIFLLE